MSDKTPELITQKPDEVGTMQPSRLRTQLVVVSLELLPSHGREKSSFLSPSSPAAVASIMFSDG